MEHRQGYAKELAGQIEKKADELEELRKQLKYVQRMCSHECDETSSGPNGDGYVVVFHKCPDCLKEWKT